MLFKSKKKCSCSQRQCSKCERPPTPGNVQYCDAAEEECCEKVVIMREAKVAEACCRPGCSVRKPCLSCAKKGVAPRVPCSVKVVCEMECPKKSCVKKKKSCTKPCSNPCQFSNESCCMKTCPEPCPTPCQSTYTVPCRELCKSPCRKPCCNTKVPKSVLKQPQKCVKFEVCAEVVDCPKPAECKPSTASCAPKSMPECCCELCKPREEQCVTIANCRVNKCCEIREDRRRFARKCSKTCVVVPEEEEVVCQPMHTYGSFTSCTQPQCHCRSSNCPQGSHLTFQQAFQSTCPTVQFRP